MNFTDPSGFFKNFCDLEMLQRNALEAFSGGYKGELFLEYFENETIRIENGMVQAPNFNSRAGYGLRAFKEDAARYSYSSVLTEESIKKAIKFVKSSNSDAGNYEIKNADFGNSLYTSKYFMNDISLEQKINFLKEIDAYAHQKSPNVRQVNASLVSSWQVVCILDECGRLVFDVRPLVRLSVMLVSEKNGKMESGFYSGGGRFGYESIVNEISRKLYVDEAIREVDVKLEAIQAPAGEMPVVLGNGWTGVLLHEAVGHGLEGDAIRKQISSFHNLLGEMVANPKVSVIDDGTIRDRRGSLNIDDEGITSERTTLIENGKLVGFMQDRMNSALMRTKSTGNGRRESYRCMPMVRMTNTFMLAGDYSRDEMISNVKKGIFAKSFTGGQVDIASGKFVFAASEAYLIENGKITTPIKGAMLIGDGPSILKKISMVGNDFSLDTGVGVCGKNGQWVPVGVGEPSVLIDNITVGGVG